MIKTCIRCGKKFDISETELSFYNQRKLEIPEMCHACRREERIRRNAPVVPRGIGRRGKNRFGIGHAMPGMMSILLLLAVFMLGKSSYPPVGGGTGSNSDTTSTQSGVWEKTYIFENYDLLLQNYEEFGKSMGYTSENKYLEAANNVIADPEAVHRTENGEEIYDLEKTKERVIVSADGYIKKFYLVKEEEREVNG